MSDAILLEILFFAQIHIESLKSLRNEAISACETSEDETVSQASKLDTKRYFLNQPPNSFPNPDFLSTLPSLLDERLAVPPAKVPCVRYSSIASANSLPD